MPNQQERIRPCFRHACCSTETICLDLSQDSKASPHALTKILVCNPLSGVEMRKQASPV